MKHNLREILHVHDSDVTDSHFANANLVHCRFQNVNFCQSKFTEVDFSEVSIAHVNLTNASITDANLTGMKINGILVSDLLAAYEAFARDAVVREWNRAASRLGLFANLRLADRIPAPIDVGESAAAFTFHMFAKRCVVVELSRVCDHRCLCLRVEIFLNLTEQRAHRIRDRCE